MAMANLGSDSGGQIWHYVCEALQNVRTLQVLLFHPTLSPLHDCLNFTAVVRHGSLHCAWDSPTGTTTNSLAVSLPACLLDLSIPAGCSTRLDHVEVRLRLLSVDPTLHMLRFSLQDEGLDDLSACRQEDAKPFSVDFDAQALESSEEVEFFCRQCSCKLTNTPFRRALELPSMDWREVSEHFYGNCCCASFGAETEILVARFQQLLTPSKGTCLVASTTCIVYEGDVIVSEDDRDTLLEPIATESGKNDVDPSALSHPGVGVEISHVEKTSGSPTLTCALDHVDCSSGGHHLSKSAEILETDSKLIHYQDGEEKTSSVSVADEIQEGCGGHSKISPGEFESRSNDHTAQDSCCSSRKPASTESSAMKEKKESSIESLGNCFMTSPGSQSEVRGWEPFLCRNCSSLVGGRRGGSSGKGVQFFKYKISTHESVASSSNIFREHTLERLFTHELEKTTESNSSYRYVVRSFRTGQALLQLVLLNQSALVSSGTCLSTSTLNSGDGTMKTTEPKFLDSVSGRETEGRKLRQTVGTKPENVSLETVAKFMFCDCRMLNSDELRLIDKWAQLQNADDIFMLDEVAGRLVNMLELHQMAYPPSCQSYQQFRLSFLSK